MGYDVHVVLTADWTQSESRPITKDAVDRLIASDTTLSWSTTDYVEMSERDGRVVRYFMITWNGVASFWWYRSEILCKDPTEAQILKLLDMARAIGGRLLGDDGERYERGKSIFGKPKIVVVRK
jgi:hypothetical protein